MCHSLEKAKNSLSPRIVEYSERNGLITHRNAVAQGQRVELPRGRLGFESPWCTHKKKCESQTIDDRRLGIT